jgi:hypothetical protein
VQAAPTQEAPIQLLEIQQEPEHPLQAELRHLQTGMQLLQTGTLLLLTTGRHRQEELHRDTTEQLLQGTIHHKEVLQHKEVHHPTALLEGAAWVAAPEAAAVVSAALEVAEEEGGDNPPLFFAFFF